MATTVVAVPTVDPAAPTATRVAAASRAGSDGYDGGGGFRAEAAGGGARGEAVGAGWRQRRVETVQPAAGGGIGGDGRALPSSSAASGGIGDVQREEWRPLGGALPPPDPAGGRAPEPRHLTILRTTTECAVD
uniref:DUF834 domain-containing protein n=1 Tax=Oryza glumipatula TaxID=40148 RepID=A0A0E0BFT1_9ORYZ